MAMFLYQKKNKSNYPLLPKLSLLKDFFQITLNKGHPHTKGWDNVSICFIRVVVDQYKNIKKSKIKKWLYQEKKRKREAKGKQEEVKQILNETLFKDPCLKQPLHHILGL